MFWSNQLTTSKRFRLDLGGRHWLSKLAREKLIPEPRFASSKLRYNFGYYPDREA